MSCITAVMDREKALGQMLPSWTRVEKIKDFVIVDWSSKKPIIDNLTIQDQIKKYKNIKIIRVENQKYFYRCLAWNLAFQNTDPKNKILLKLDGDYMNINPSWIDCLRLTEDKLLDDYFITGASEFMSSSFGFLLVNKINFNKGYNENLRPIWGFEDYDLYKRIKREPCLEQSSKNWDGLNQILFFNIKNHILHLDHSEEERHQNTEFKDLIIKEKRGITLKEKWKNALKNKSLAEHLPDWKTSKYKVLEETEFYKRVELIKN